MLIVCNGMFRSGSTLQYNLVRSLVEKMAVGEGKGWFTYEQLNSMQGQLEKWSQEDFFYVIKSHAMIPDSDRMTAAGVMKICYTYRDIRDVAVSIKRKFQEEGEAMLKLLDKSTKTYFRLKELDGVIWQQYETMIGDLEQTARDLAYCLELDPSEEIIHTVATECSLDNTKKEIAKLRFRLKVKNKVYNLLRRLHADQLVASMAQIVAPEFSWRSQKYDQTNLLHTDHISSNSGAVGLWQNSLSQQEIELLTQRYGHWLTDAGYPL